MSGFYCRKEDSMTGKALHMYDKLMQGGVILMIRWFLQLQLVIINMGSVMTSEHILQIILKGNYPLMTPQGGFQ